MGVVEIVRPVTAPEKSKGNAVCLSAGYLPRYKRNGGVGRSTRKTVEKLAVSMLEIQKQTVETIRRLLRVSRYRQHVLFRDSPVHSRLRPVQEFQPRRQIFHY